MEGFLDIRLKPWLRRLITRLIAIVPALVVIVAWGQSGTARLLVLSQVVLSMQLSFAVFPLVMFTGDRRKMGDFTNSEWIKALAWAVGRRFTTSRPEAAVTGHRRRGVVALARQAEQAT